MWKSILLFFLFLYFFLSVSSKIIRFFRQIQEAAVPKKTESEGKMRIFIPEEHWNKKDFKGGEYTDFEEVK
ncbi:MAG: hypothetical protein OHK0045_07310 [Raineya sp.]